MLNIEEYIATRKKEDKLNEFDLDKRIENIRACTNYIFEYFHQYLDIAEIKHKTILSNENIDKYHKQLREYDKDVQDWLVGFYDKYGRYMNRVIGNILDEEDVFLLYNTDDEFESISYECYSKLIKKYPFLKDQENMLLLFIKNYHRVKSNDSRYKQLPPFFKSISEWIEITRNKFNVNILAFANLYINRFYDEVDKWPQSHKKKSRDAFIQYEYDYKCNKNLFNLDYIYTKVCKKEFIKGHKQELELIMMYYWIHDIEGDEEYWEEYLKKTLLVLNE